MSPRTETGRALFGTIAFLVVIALVVVAGLAFYNNRPGSTRYAAMLDTVIGLYPGADVRVLGVQVGSVDKVTPMGTEVRVDFHVNGTTKVPAGANAAVVAPTVVADRYLQLSPIYTGGPTMAAGTVIPASRTASPAEFDDLLASTEKLSDALGPNGVNRTGALSDALRTAAANLNGNGQNINTTLGNLSKAVTTLSANRDNLAGTVTNLQRFTGTLKDDDGQVRAFTQQFAQVSGYLSDERKDLGETLRELADTLDDVRHFVKDNRGELRRNVDQLSDVLRTVNHEKLSLDQTLSTAPTGLDGLVNAYDAASGTLHTRPALIPTILCGLFGLFPATLQTALLPLLGPLLNAIIPGGLAACPTLASTPLFDQINAYINSLLNGTAPTGTTPSLLPGVTGLLNNSAQALTALPQGSSAPAARSHPEKLAPPRPRPSLGQLLGGGL